MCIHLTPVLYCITTVLIEVYLLCLFESVSLRDIGKPTSRAQIGSPSSLYLKAVKGAHLGSALISFQSAISGKSTKTDFFLSLIDYSTRETKITPIP